MSRKMQQLKYKVIGAIYCKYLTARKELEQSCFQKNPNPIQQQIEGRTRRRVREFFLDHRIAVSDDSMRREKEEYLNSGIEMEGLAILFGEKDL